MNLFYFMVISLLLVDLHLLLNSPHNKTQYYGNI